ncbi:MAG: sigma-70 family RNA polymerase sigma factor, partial [Gemmatimonadetes bacterium]|nr:sigma-70 family RNA polymerase sigma factor [Gemmatimonadota bacterium]
MTANLRFVISYVKKYQGRGLGLAELVCIGNEGLLKAVKKFDPEKGVKFISYAVWWIRQRILAAIANHTVVRRPCTVRNAAYKLTTTTRRLSQQLHRSPTDDELAEDTGLSLDCIHDVRGGYPELSLDAALSEDPNAGDLSDVLGVPPPPHSDVSPYLSGLTERELDVVRLVAEGFDVGIRVGRLDDSSLVTRALGPAERIFVASPSYLARQSAPREPSDLSSHALRGLSAQERWLVLHEGRIRPLAVSPRLLA